MTKDREHIRAGPLAQVLSIKVEPKKAVEDKKLLIYGKIYSLSLNNDNEAQVYYLYNRGRDNPEILNQSSTLTLTGLADTCHPLYLCKLMSPGTVIVVDIWNANKNHMCAQGKIIMRGATKDNCETVRQEIVNGTGCFVKVCYIVMPLAILCRLEVQFYKKICDDVKQYISRVVNVNGKITAQYGETYGDYASQECTLFEKYDGSEELVIDKPKNLKVSRCWMSLPAYSSLILNMNLSSYQGKIVFPARNSWMSNKVFALDDDVYMQVNVAWFPHYLHETWIPSHRKVRQWLQRNKKTLEISIPHPQQFAVITGDTQMKDQSSLDHGSSSSSTIPSDPRDVYHQELNPSRMVEVYSIFIGGGDKNRATRLFGTIEISSGDRTFPIFNKQQDDPFELGENLEMVPIPDGYRVCDDDFSIELKFKLMDIDRTLSIFEDSCWNLEQLNTYSSLYDKQLCSVIQGEHGFVALYYSIFSSAVQAEIEVHCKRKKGSSYSVCGRLVAEYNDYDYSNDYEKQYYRTVLFNRTELDRAALVNDERIPLSRSIVVVPSNSKLVLDVDLRIVDPSSGLTVEGLTSSVEIDFSVSSARLLETKNCQVQIFVKWSGHDLFVQRNWRETLETSSRQSYMEDTSSKEMQ